MAPFAALYIGLVFSGGAIALLLAFGQLLIRDRRAGNLLLCGIYGAIALIEFHAALFGALPELRAALPHLAACGPWLLLLPGPPLLAFVRDVLLARALPYRRTHLLPPLLLGLGMAPFFVLDALLATGLLSLESAWLARASETYFQCIYWLDPAANILLLGYLTAVVWHLQRRRRELISGRRAAHAVTLILGLSVAAVFSNLAGFVLGPERALLDGGGAILLALVMHLTLLLAHVTPEVLYVMRPLRAFDAEKSGSPLRGLDPQTVEGLEAELRRLMEAERLYCDEDLQLESVADELGLRPSQLTYFLNRVLGRNFAGFVNEYRVREAERLLLESPERSVLHAGYAAGFNSKAAFYRVFQQTTGLSPAEYRRRHRSQKRSE